MTESAEFLPDENRGPVHGSPGGDQPDWLVSSDQGAEDERRAGEDGQERQHLRLTTSNDLSEAVPFERPKVPQRPDPVEAEKAERSQGPKPWTGAASSVPKLTVTAAGPPKANSVSSSRESAPAPVRPAPARPAAAASAGWEEDDLDAENHQGFPDDTGPLAPVTPLPVRHLDEPFWVVALEALRDNRQLQLGILAAILIPLAIWIAWPKGEPGVSIHALRQEPARWDGQTVRIGGRVGDVFHVGAGVAFNLHQSRDTIVVFTRGAAPRPRDKVTVVGSVSTGYLDGQPRQAIFAEP